MVDVRYQNLKPIGGGSYGFAHVPRTTRPQWAKLRSWSPTCSMISLTPSNLTRDQTPAALAAREHHLHKRYHSLPNTIEFSDVYIITDLMESTLIASYLHAGPLGSAFPVLPLPNLSRPQIHPLGERIAPGSEAINLLVNANCDWPSVTLGSRGASTTFTGAPH